MTDQWMVHQFAPQPAHLPKHLQEPIDREALWRQAPPAAKMRHLGRPIRALVVAAGATAEQVESLLDQVEGSLYEITRAGDLDEAAELLRTRPLDVVLMAIAANGDDPLVSLGRLQETAPMAAYILVGDARHERGGLAAIRHGAQDYLVLEDTDGRLAKRAIRFAMERKAVHNGLQATHQALQRTIDEQASRCRAITDELDHANATHRDVEQRLQGAHELNRTVLQEAGVLILVLDPQGRIIHFNPQCEKLTGLDAASAEGRPITDVLPSLTPAGLDTLYEEVRLRREAVVNREQWPGPDGRPRLIEWTNTSVGEDPSRPTMVVRIGVDVTTREEMQEALRQSERQLRLITDALPALIAYIDGSGHYRIANQAHAQWLGLDADAVEGTALADVWPSEALAELEPHIQRLSTELTRQDFNITLHGLPGGEREITGTLVPDHPAHGRAPGFFALLHDVTDYRQAQRRERERLRELAHVARLNTFGGMSGQITHELKQPLTAISAYSEACLRLLPRRGVEGREVRDALAALSKQARRATDIVQRISRLVRKSQTAPAALEPNPLLSDVLCLLSSETDLSDIELQLDLDDGLPFVWADSVLIEQVLLNLIRNALDALAQSPAPQRRLTIRTALGDDGMVLMEVADTGPGLPPRLIERMFDPFYTTKPDGMGMGLSISQSIAEAHNGRLWAENNDGGGAVLRLALPPHQRQ